MRFCLAIILAAVIPLFMVGCSDDGGDVTGISLSTNWLALTMSQTGNVSATTQGGSADIEWHSSNPSVATVSGRIITPISTGTSQITASAVEFTSAPCEVHIAEDWILYSDGTQLRLIDPADTSDMPIPGTDNSEFEVKGPMLWMANGIVYHTLAPFDYSYLWFKPFDGGDAYMITPDTIEPIYDIRANPEGGFFLTVYQDIHALNSTTPFQQYVNSEHLYYSREGVTMEGLDISPDGDKFVTACRLGTSPRMVLFDLNGESSMPTDTLDVTYLAVCPRFDPSGDKIAYGYATTVGRLWTVDIPSGTPVNVITEGREIAGLDWSPDGSEIVMCVRNMLNEYELWIGNPTTGATRKLNSAQASTKPYLPQWVD